MGGNNICYKTKRKGKASDACFTEQKNFLLCLHDFPGNVQFISVVALFIAQFCFFLIGY